MSDQKISDDPLLDAATADLASDYFPIIDASEADANKNKRMLLTQLKTKLVDVASAANYRGNTTDKLLDTDGIWSAAGTVTLTDASTIAVDMSTFINAKVTLAGNRTLGNPSNAKVGQSGVIEVLQDGTGTRTLAYDTNYIFAGGTEPVLTTTASARDVLAYVVLNDSKVLITAILDAKA